jgi:hypothetical protein
VLYYVARQEDRFTAAGVNAEKLLLIHLVGGEHVNAADKQLVERAIQITGVKVVWG